MDRRLQTPDGGGREGIRGGPRFQTLEGAERERARAPGRRGRGRPGPRPEGVGGAGAPRLRNGRGRPGPDRDAEVGSPSILTSEHRLRPRNYGHHHGLLLVLPFLAFERHLEAVERGPLGLQGHGAAGVCVRGGDRGDRTPEAGRAARGRLPPRAAPSPPPAAHRPTCDGRVRASPRPSASGPRAGRAQSGAPGPRRSLLWRLIVGALPDGPPRARPRPRAANRAWPRPGHAAPLAARGPAGRRGGPRAPRRPAARRRALPAGGEAPGPRGLGGVVPRAADRARWRASRALPGALGFCWGSPLRFPNEPSAARRCPGRERIRRSSEKGLGVGRGDTEFLLIFASSVTLGTLSVFLDDLILSRKTLWRLLDKGMRKMEEPSGVWAHANHPRWF